jgi:hypothetical protein
MKPAHKENEKYAIHKINNEVLEFKAIDFNDLIFIHAYQYDYSSSFQDRTDTNTP